ncbi:MAG: hypothetical protein ACFE0R_13880 [Salinarimonas sp.]
MRAMTRDKNAVAVGYPRGGDPEQLEKAVYQEFGTEGGASGGGWGGPIPERPFLRNTMRDNRRKYLDFLSHQAEGLLLGTSSLPAVLARLGAVAESDVKNTIGSNMPPALSPVTIERKGSARTLVDSGAMAQSVRFEVRRHEWGGGS